MSNSNASLPVRSESDGVDAKLVVKLVDGQSGGSNQMRIDSDNNAHVESHGNDPAGLDHALTLTEEGRTTSRGDYNGTTNTKPSSTAAILHSRQASPTEAHQTFRPSGVVATDGSNAHAADVALRDASGNAFTELNPLAVTMVGSAGTEINAPFTTAALASAASATHDYTVTTLKSGKLSQIQCSGTGKLQVDISIETAAASGIFTRTFTKFNSVAEPNVEFDLHEILTVAAGVKIRATLTNLDEQAQDVYTTISLHEI